MIIKVFLVILFIIQFIFLFVKVKAVSQKKYFIPAFLVSAITAWFIYQSVFAAGFAAVNLAILSFIGMFALFVFTKHPPFLREEGEQ
ncbi:hypothetical protein [Bacillus marinisedimentorum]|uniref:hypothetical protein n=1 Tax=Bacillus marinisedimentorum TaxID=1821260 RepID=UPI00087223EA|nr:hypothetical protein [Bacillus marinisedimentorum]